jgi:hypothetical protein
MCTLSVRIDSYEVSFSGIEFAGACNENIDRGGQTIARKILIRPERYHHETLYQERKATYFNRLNSENAFHQEKHGHFP